MQNRIFALESGDLDSKIDIIGQDELALLSKNSDLKIKNITLIYSKYMCVWPCDILASTVEHGMTKRYDEEV